MPTLFPPEYPDRPDAPLLAFGPSFSEELSRSMLEAIPREKEEKPTEFEVRAAAGLTMFEAFHPRDHLECMLAAQGVGMHLAIMDCLRRTTLSDTSEAVAAKLRGNVSQLSRSFSTLLRDLERRQTRPLPERPREPPSPPASGAPPDDYPMPDDPASNEASPGDAPDGTMADRPMAGALIPSDPVLDDASEARPRPKRSRVKSPPKASGATATVPANAPQTGPARCNAPPRFPLNLDDVPDVPEDIETRPDGTPGSLRAYAPKPLVEEFIPREPAIMIALATRPGPYRMVNAPKDQLPGDNGQDPSPPADAGVAVPVAAAWEDARPTNPAWPEARGPLDLRERIFTGDALARFASARFDPDAPVEPLRFEDEDSVVELELVSTGGDPAAEAERAAMMAAHPEGKPIVTFRHGVKRPPDEPQDRNAG